MRSSACAVAEGSPLEGAAALLGDAPGSEQATRARVAAQNDAARRVCLGTAEGVMTPLSNCVGDGCAFANALERDIILASFWWR